MNKPHHARRMRVGTIAGAAAALFAAYAQPALANPTGAQVVSGSVSVNSPSAGQMNITQGTPNAIVNWNTFSIGASEGVSIVQPSATSALLNRVVGNDQSVIAGHLHANGRVFLVNPAGVIFTPGSSVNVGSMIASTLNIADGDFLAGKYRFVGASTAPVANAGTLTAQDGGTIALLGGTVSNTGVVSARLGTVALGAGSDITVDFAGDGLTTLRIDRAAANALVGNAGTLAADGGTVVMSAQTADALAGTVLNQQGVVRARSIAERDGHIFLDGGPNGVTLVSGTLDATGGAALTGGRIDVTGHDVALLAGANVDAGGAAGGGTVRVGGGARGADPTIRNADALWMSPAAQVRADALAYGNGGHIVAYSDSVARLYGTLSAKGGAQGGNGGFIETSSHSLDTSGAKVDASAPAGLGGTWLIDPYAVSIVSGASTVTTGAAGGSVTFAYSTFPDTQLTNGTIEAELNNGTSVVVSTQTSTQSGAGDIDVNASIAKTLGGDAKFTLSASGSIAIAYGVSITSIAGKLDVLLDASVGTSSTQVPASSIVIGSGGTGIPVTTIATNGGNVVIDGNGGFGNVSIGNANVTTAGGNVAISGNNGGVGLTRTRVDTAGGTVQIAGNVTAGASMATVNAPSTVSIGGVVVDQSTIDTHGGSVQISADVNSPATTTLYYVSNPVTTGSVVVNQSTIDTQGGNVTIQGKAETAIPVTTIVFTPTITTGGVFVDQSSIGTLGGSVGITGSAVSGDGVALNQSLVDAGAGSGSVLIAGLVSGTASGTGFLASSTTISAGGAIGLSGFATGSGSEVGSDLSGVNVTSTSGGNVSLSGNATGQYAIGIETGASTFSTAGGAIGVTGTATGTGGSTGISLFNSSATDTTGAITLTGTATGGNAFGVELFGLHTVTVNNVTTSTPTLNATGGAITVTGTASGLGGTGVALDGGATLVDTSGAIAVNGNVTSASSFGSTGISMQSNTSISTGSGNITLTGLVPSTADFSTGIGVYNSASIASSSGAIALTGESVGSPSANASVQGVVLGTLVSSNLLSFAAAPASPSVTTGSGTLSIDGSGSGTQAAGVLVAGGGAIRSTNGGNIDIRGAVASGGASGVQNDFGVLVLNGSVKATGATGNIAIAGSTNTADPGVALGYVIPATSDGQTAGPVSVSTANPGTITLRASNDGTASSLLARTFDGNPVVSSPNGVLVVAPAAVDPANGFAVTAVDAAPITLLGAGAGLSVDPTTFGNFANFQTMIFGSSTQTGLITVNGACASGATPCVPTKPSFTTNLTLENEGAGSHGIVLPYGISMPAYTLTLASAGAVTDPGGIQAAGLLLAGPGTFTLTDPQNAVGVLAMAGAGNVNFLNSIGFAIGPIVSKTYDSTTGQVTTIDATNSTLTGNLVAQAATGNLSLGGGTPAPNGPTGGLDTNLTAGGSVDLVMENGVFKDAGAGTISAGSGWRIWAQTWNGETRGNVQPNTAQPNFYGCLFGAGCNWGGVVPATGNHYVYVNRPPLTVTAGDASRPALTPNPPFSYTVAGWINGDSPGTLTGSVTTPATQTSPIGTYPIDPNFASSIGYVVNQVPGTLTVLPVLESSLPLAQSGLQSFFGNSEQTFVYENNLQGTNICIGSSQPLFTSAPPGDKQDLLAVEWKRVRQQPNLNSCLVTNSEHGCGDF
ncbi:beta strand repeat-containing protein [Burkholderia sp. MR1-5-21]